jgi:hypothetical protein
MSSNLNKPLLIQRVLEEIENCNQLCRVYFSRSNAEAKVAARSHGDNSALERIGETEKYFKQNFEKVEEYISGLLEDVRLSRNTGINNMTAPTMRERAVYHRLKAEEYEKEAGLLEDSPLSFERRKSLKQA